MNHEVLILGAGAAMGRALAKRFAANGSSLTLAGRNLPELEKDAADLHLRFGTPCRVAYFDAGAVETHEPWVTALTQTPEVVICAFGYLPDPPRLPSDHAALLQTIAVNYTGAVSVLNALGKRMAGNEKGWIVGISSIAGDRGRASNGIYGSAKAGFTAYLSALRQSLAATGVKVLTVKPGFVYSAMTAHMDMPPLLTATPEKVASDVIRAMRSGRCVCYTPWFWGWMMRLIRWIPEGLFVRMKF